MTIPRVGWTLSPSLWGAPEHVLFTTCGQVPGFSQAFWGAYEGEGLYHWRMLMQDGWPLHMRALSLMIVRPCPTCERNGYPKSGMSLVIKSLGSLRASCLCRPCSSSRSLTNLLRCIREQVTLSLADYWCKMDGHYIWEHEAQWLSKETAK